MTPRRAVPTLLALLLLAAGARAQTGERFSASGRVLDPAGEPVPCCLVEVQIWDSFGRMLWAERARTRGDGSFFADGLPCRDPSLETEVVAVPLCCDGESERVPTNGCVDPVTGGPLEHVDLGDITCADEPVTNQTLLTGRTVCRDGVFLEPVADCAIRLQPSGMLELGQLTWTAADGTWELCTACEPGTVSERVVESQCCGELDGFALDGCPERVERPDVVCDPCPVPSCPEPREVVLNGRLVCPDPAGGPPTPVPDCRLDVWVDHPCLGDTGLGPFETTTRADGTWSVCVPCPLPPDCEQWLDRWSVVVSSDCCGTALSQDVVGCAPEIQLADTLCWLGPGGECPPAPACATGETLVSGRLTCGDPALPPEPVPGCPVTISCPGGASVETLTGPDGRYEACLPCDGCDVAVVSALCCDAQTSVDVLGCPAAASADLHCRDCPPPPRPCPPPDAVQVGGSVACSQADGTATPLAGCAVVLEPVSATGMPLDPVVTASFGDGSFLDCVPCGPDGLSELTARAECCGESTTVPVDGCPETLSVDPLLCDGCSPCPAGMSRLQGGVHCRGDGPVAGCRVRVNLETCDGTETYFAETDAQGRYRLCLPCPCAGTVVRVTAECCDGTTVREIEDCGPVIPMRTIHCAGDCP